MEDMVVSKYPDIIEISAVEPLADFVVRVTFSDSSQRVIDLEPYLFGPVFEPIHSDQQLFRRVFVDHGVLTWPNGADIDTDTLYYDGPPPWAQQEPMPKASANAKTAKRRNSQSVVKHPKKSAAKDKSRKLKTL